MMFRQLYDHETSTYTYLIAEEKTKEAVLVDPVSEQVERDLKLIQELGLTLRYCLETHIHADHITGTGKLRELTGCEGVVPENAQAACANRFIKDEEVLKLGNIEIEAIAGLINIKDYFWFKQGVSLSLSEAQQQTIRVMLLKPDVLIFS